MKKITLLVVALLTSIYSHAIDDGTYALPSLSGIDATITFDNTAEVFTITLTGSTTTGYIGIGFHDSSAGQMGGKYALYIVNNGMGSFELSEQSLADFGLGTTLTAQASIDSQDAAVGNITISRAYAATNGGYSFSSTDTELHYIVSRGAIAGSYHGGVGNRIKASTAITGGGTAGINSLPELEGLVVSNNFSENTIGLQFLDTVDGVYDVEVLNSVGQTVLSKQLNSDIPVHPLNELSDKPAGVYFVRFGQNGKYITKQVIKN